MYLVEYTKICRNKLKKGLKKCCSCFYIIEEAVDFAKKLIDNSNVKSIKVSDVEISISETIYEMDHDDYDE